MERARIYDSILGGIATAAFGAIAIVVGVEHYWLRDLKFDDAWIHFRYAKNIAHGLGFVYNDGEHVLGSGGPLWNVLLAGLVAVAGEQGLSGAVSIFNYGALLACAWVLWCALKAVVPPWLALVIATVLLAHGPLVVSSIGGMETTLLCLLQLASLLSLMRGRFVLASLSAGTAACLRIEGLALAAATVLAASLYRRREAWRAFVAAAIVPAAAYGFAWVYFGSPLPTSTMAKNLVYEVPPFGALKVCLLWLRTVLPFQDVLPFARSHPSVANALSVAAWVLLMQRGYVRLRRLSPAASLVALQVIGAIAFYALANPLMFVWYPCTFLPLATILAALGMVEVAQHLPIGPRVRYASVVVVIAALSIGSMRRTWLPFVSPDDPRFSFSLPNASEHSRIYQYANIARWLNDRARPDDRVCIIEIGAFGYHYRGRILDGIGLVSPEVLPYHAALARQRPGGTGMLLPEVVRDFRPEFVVSLDVFAAALLQNAWFKEHYEVVGRWPWFAGPARWRNLPTALWDSPEMRAYRRRDVPWTAGAADSAGFTFPTSVFLGRSTAGLDSRIWQHRAAVPRSPTSPSGRTASSVAISPGA